ncbi:MAG TPA: flagellar hook-length control protein FliK, partial [Nitrospiria bacterium]|nr:flagellar hook-length control protein FliK [Nitrospiria bacterium]
TLQGKTDTVRPFIIPYPLHPLLKDLLLPGDLTDIIGRERLDHSDENNGDSPGPFQNNPALKEKGSSAFEPIKLSPLGAGETGPDPSILACQSGDRGDLNNKPGLEREPENEIDKKNGLSFQRGPSNKGDFRGALENCSDKAPDRIIPDSNPDLNLNGSYPRLPAPSGNTTRAEAGPSRTASPEKTSFSFHEVSDVSSKRPIYLFKEDTSSVRINLDGDDFGKLKLDISTRGNMVKANIVTDHPIVKEMIEVNQGQLKDALSGQGLEISYLSVSVDGDQSEGLNYKEVIENSLSRKDHDRELKEEDAILACHTLSHQDSGVNIFV